jgi:hypothetical protein
MSGSFNVVWDRIARLAGSQFKTKTGLEFTYIVDIKAFYPSRTKYRISKADFEVAYKFVPCDGPGVLNETVRGSSYIWAVLHDSRIRLSEW